MSVIKDTGFVDLSTFVNVNTGNASWNSPGNAQTSNNAYAITGAVTGAGQVVFRSTSDLLRATGPSGILIPSHAIILGIEVRFERKKRIDGTGNIWDTTIRLVKNNALVGNNKSAGSAWPFTEAYVSHGGSADLWGTTWSPSDIGANFGFAVAVDYEVPGSNDLSAADLDHMQIRIHYDAVYDNEFFLAF